MARASARWPSLFFRVAMSRTANTPNWRSRLASIGRAQSAVEVRIGAPDGSHLPPGEHGEIMVRGETVMPGYWGNPDATAKTLIDGWLMTGDMGFIDMAGYVTLQGRSKDMIISGGSNIYPREVEEVLLTHPKVNEASVVGRAHPDWGEEVVAFVVGSATPDQLDKLCAPRTLPASNGPRPMSSCWNCPRTIMARY